MTTFLLAAATFLMLTLLAGAYRILCGPSRADRMLTAQLFGTTGDSKSSWPPFSVSISTAINPIPALLRPQGGEPHRPDGPPPSRPGKGRASGYR